MLLSLNLFERLSSGSTWTATVGFILGTITILTVTVLVLHIAYNLYLHPLRNHPGPKSWAASRLPWCWYQVQGRLNQKLLDLHSHYGHTVRIGPNEVSYTAESAWKSIYGHRSVEMSRDPYFRLHTPTGAKNIFVADRDTHVRQRRLLSHAFSERALREQEDILMMYTNRFVQELSARADEEHIDIVKWFSLTTFDLIGDLSFGDNFGCLESGEYDPYISSTPEISKELTFTQMLFYFNLGALRKYVMPAGVAGARAQNMKRAMAFVEKRVQRETDRKDFLHYILAANDEKGMSRAEIDVNAFSFSTAGSESTATLMAAAVFYTLSKAELRDRLVHEVRKRFASEDEIKLSNLNDLEYLDAVLMEASRLYPPVAGTLPRVVPSPGETIDGTFVPPGVSVGVNHYSCYRSPLNFHRPNEFLPQRWLAESRDKAPFHGDNRNAVQPFSFGPRNCLGKNLAKAEMRLILAKLFWRFDVELVEGGGAWREEHKVFGFWVKPPLLCKLKPVKRA